MKIVGLILLVLVIFSAGIFLGSNYLKSPSVTPTPIISPTIISITTTPVDDSTSLISAMQEAVAAKNNLPSDSFIVSVGQITGNFAKGSVNPPTPGPGGGLFFAAKINGVWKLVWDGNGIITCDDLKSYPDFPTSLIPSCFATSSGKLITR